MNFGDALICLRDGERATREGWNARGMFVVLQKGYPDGIPINSNTATATGLPEGAVCRFRPYLMLCAADGSFVPWAPTVSDVLGEDWCCSCVGGEQVTVSSSAPEDAERVARAFHETYERLAPQHGYETRKASAVPWADVPENNKSLMIAVVADLLADGPITLR